MSLGGGEASPAVIVYGPDGRAYGSPADAMAAGVGSPTMSPPAAFPISYPGQQPYTPAPMPNIPMPSSGGRNRYAEIMANYQQAQPYSFTSMPSDYTGGFTPYQRPIPAPSLPVEQLPYAGLIEEINRGSQGSGNPESREATQASIAARDAAWQASDQEGYANRNSGVLKVVNALANLTPIPTVKKVYDFFNPSVDEAGPSATPYAGSYMGPAPAPVPVPTMEVKQYYQGDAADAGPGWTQEGYGARGATRLFRTVQVPTETRINPEDNQPYTVPVGYTGGGGGAVSGGGGMLSSQSAATRADLRSNEGYGGLYKGGHVSMMHLQGPDPMGPDDGYAALKDGEYVINDKAVKKYGIELMNLINSGKISKGKLRGLLEM